MMTEREVRRRIVVSAVLRERPVEIHAEPCARCPSALFPAGDPMTRDFMAASREEQLESVFHCAWRPGKACKGYCAMLGVTEADLRAHVEKLP